MIPPLVSIVIPTFNRASLVTRAIESLLAQTYGPLDVIVVDDGSTDDTAAALAPYVARRQVRVVRHPSNLGATAAKNAGLDAVRGDYASILDSDDELVPEAVQTIMDAFAQGGAGVGMVFANCVDADTGEWTGTGLEASGPVTFADAVSERFRGEFWGIWRTEVLGARRFDTRLAGGESLVWHDMYRSTRVWYLHAALRRYYRGSADRVSRRQLDPDQAARTRLIYELYLERFGEDLKRLAPHVYAKNLQAIALWHILGGERSRALAPLAGSLRYTHSPKQWLMAIGMCVVPRSVLQREAERRRG
ncbi:MAG: glycosyltransferase family 2 protein [Acidobacteria bacterium]|nr:glycosyltransferase family 2 protein [Acidobacteriota bacterium]